MQNHTHFLGKFVTVLLLFATQISSAQPAKPQDVAAIRGFAIMQDQRTGNCVACHSVPDARGKTTGIQSTFAPPLQGVGARYSSKMLSAWVVDARELNPQTLMPPFGKDLGNGRLLNDAQIADVLAALARLQ